MHTPSILLLCENEASAQLDRRSLREAGYAPARLMSSGIEAAKLLAGLADDPEHPRPDMVVCATRLEDMDGEQFCAIIRSHPLLIGLPVLLLVSNTTEAEQLRTLGCGASAMLARPYSVAALKSQMDRLLPMAASLERLEAGKKQADTRAFDEALATYGVLLRPDREPEDYFRVGMRCLQDKNWNGALAAYQHALRGAQVKAEAELGMAAAYKGKGDSANCKLWLGKGTSTLIRAKRWHLARSAYTRLLRHDPTARNPFLSEAHRLMRAHSYEEAADTLIESLEVWQSSDTGDRLARLCFNADDPQAMLKALEDGLSRQSVVSPEVLSGQVREALGILHKEREERERQLAAERKWKLAREIASRNAEKSAQDVPAAPAYAPQADDRPVVGIETVDSAPAVPLLGEEDLPDPDDSAAVKAIEPIRESGGDLLSVIRLTWDLARRSRKR